MSLNIHFHDRKPPYTSSSITEWNEFWDQSPDLFNPIKYCMQVTHNCAECASHVQLETPYLINTEIGLIYKSGGITLFNVLWHGDAFNIFQGKDMIPFLDEALPILQYNYKFYHQFDSSNGYGDVFSLIRFCIMLLVECKEHPNAYLHYSR